MKKLKVIGAATMAFPVPPVPPGTPLRATARCGTCGAVGVDENYVAPQPSEGWQVSVSIKHAPDCQVMCNAAATGIYDQEGTILAFVPLERFDA